MQDALSLAGESIHIPDAQFPSFVEVAFRGVINSNERNAIESMYSRYRIAYLQNLDKHQMTFLCTTWELKNETFSS